MADIMNEPDLWLQIACNRKQQSLLIFWIFSKETILHQKAVFMMAPPKEKKRNCTVYPRLDPSQSVFGIDILGNPDIQDPACIKFRRIFRDPYSVFAIIVELFRCRDEWNPARSTAPGAPSPHTLEIKVLCVLFILGRGTNIDTVSILSHISIGTLTTFFHHFCEKKLPCMMSIFS